MHWDDSFSRRKSYVKAYRFPPRGLPPTISAEAEELIPRVLFVANLDRTAHLVRTPF